MHGNDYDNVVARYYAVVYATDIAYGGYDY